MDGRAELTSSGLPVSLPSRSRSASLYTSSMLHVGSRARALAYHVLASGRHGRRGSSSARLAGPRHDEHYTQRMD